MITKLYTDGSALGTSPNYIGGWAIIIESETFKDLPSTLSGAEYPATNNQMELKAIFEAVKWAMEKHETHPEEHFIICSDSQYALSSVTDWMYKWAKNSWTGSNKKVVKNLGMMRAFYSMLNPKPAFITFEKVKGHSGDANNEMADGVAVHESTRLKEKLMAEGVLK